MATHFYTPTLQRTSRMPGFGEFTHTYETRLLEKPFWRKGTYCPKQSPLGKFAAQHDAQRKKNAASIRDARLSISSAFDKNLALRRQRERVLGTADGIVDADEKRDYVSAALRQNMDKVDLTSLRSRLGLQLSQSGGALSTGELKLTYDPRKSFSAREVKRTSGSAASNARRAADEALRNLPDVFQAVEEAHSRRKDASKNAMERVSKAIARCDKTVKKADKIARVSRKKMFEEQTAASVRLRADIDPDGFVEKTRITEKAERRKIAVAKQAALRAAAFRASRARAGKGVRKD